jgi:hypothetical protein
MKLPPKSNPSPSDCLHQGFIATVKVIQIFGIFFSSIATLIIGANGGNSYFGIVLIASVYLLTQGTIAIVDLLSCIEKKHPVLLDRRKGEKTCNCLS